MRWNGHPVLQTAFRLLGPLVFCELCTELAFFLCSLCRMEDALLVTGGGALLAIPFLFASYRKQRNTDLRKSGSVIFRGCSFSFLAGVGACLCLNPVILNLFSGSYGWDETRAVLYEAPLFLRAAVTLLLAPVAEELIFRGLIRTELRQWMDSAVAMLFGAALFGLYHGNISQGIYAFLLGICLELVCNWSHSLLPAIFLHAGANAAALCFTQFKTVMQDLFQVPYAYLPAAAGLCLAALTLYKTKEVFCES